MPHRRRLQRRWRGRHPALRWRIQRVALRARGEADAYGVEHHMFWVDTPDGIRLAGTRLGGDPETAIVLTHGFMGYRTKRPWRVLAEGLAERFTVFTFDLRGHGQSGGACTGGEHEMVDVETVVRYARERGFKRVVTVGGSLGGIAVVFQAAHYGGIDGCVAISTPALWGTHSTKAVKRMQWVFTSTMGRAAARRLMGTRINLQWGDPDPPADVVAKIAPVPLLIVHGSNDHFFPPSDAELLYERAAEPKKLWIVEGFGHAEDGFTPAFATQLAGEIDALLRASTA